jgi:hypothetical protein
MHIVSDSRVKIVGFPLTSALVMPVRQELLCVCVFDSCILILIFALQEYRCARWVSAHQRLRNASEPRTGVCVQLHIDGK